MNALKLSIRERERDLILVPAITIVALHIDFLVKITHFFHSITYPPTLLVFIHPPYILNNLLFIFRGTF